MKKRSGYGILVAAVALIALFFCGGVRAKASYLDQRVLFISSYSYSWVTVQKQIEGMTSVFEEDVTLDYEFMNTARVNDERAITLFYETIKHRLENEKAYDVIIAGDDVALSFVLQYQEELFQGVPILFLGINNESLGQQASLRPKVSGLLERFFPEENIRLGLKMRPDAKRVYIILDDSAVGVVERRNFFACSRKFPELEFVEINVSELSETELQNTVKGISENDILLFATAMEDCEGNRYSSAKIVKLLSENSKTPVLTLLDMGIGEGFAGGYVSSLEEAGRKVAELADDVMTEQNAKEFDIIMDHSSKYLFDGEALKRYKVDSSILPKSAVILNKPQSFFEQNKKVLIPVFLLGMAMLLVIVIIFVNNIRYRNLLQELEGARTILKSASQHDFLTGLGNRSKFMDDCEVLIEEKRPCTIFMIDIDNFKEINDNYGHSAGDEALRLLAVRLKEMQSQILMAYRFAGDEFILVLQSTQERIVEKTAYMCRQLFSKHFNLCEQRMKISGSIGIASYPKDAEDVERMVICADVAMYRVKKKGKNDFAFYRKENEQAISAAEINGEV